MNGASIIAQALKNAGIERVYLFPGGTIAPLLDEPTKIGTDYICTINEQGAGYAAIGAAKITGKPQVVMVTSGPGATNLVTPVADAYYDSVPIIAITGQVGTKDINYAKKIRQTGFQETDSRGIFTPITKNSKILTKDVNLYDEIMESIAISTGGRPGPVHIDLPMDVQRDDIQGQIINKDKWSPATKSDGEKPGICEDDIEAIRQQILGAKKPLVLVGNGVFLSEACRELNSFISSSGIPVVSSLPAVGLIPSNNELYYGFIGHTGEYHANLSVFHCDLLIVLGARLDVRQTGTEIKNFADNKKIIRVDIDKNELEYGRITDGLKINCDVKEFLTKILTSWNTGKIEITSWIETLNGWRKDFNSIQFYKDIQLSSPAIIESVKKHTNGKKVVVTTGVGIHQHLVARYFDFAYPERIFFTSAGHGTMGYDIPAMIGALIADKTIDLGIVFVGDGSFQMNIQELATIYNLGLPIKIIILDNKRLGLVSQFQLLNWEKDHSTGNKSNPDFSRISEAYGIKGYDLKNSEELSGIIGAVFSDNKPAVVHCFVDEGEDVLPMLMGGQKMNQMYPFKGEI